MSSTIWFNIRTENWEEKPSLFKSINRSVVAHLTASHREAVTPALFLAMQEQGLNHMHQCVKTVRNALKLPKLEFAYPNPAGHLANSRSWLSMPYCTHRTRLQPGYVGKLFSAFLHKRCVSYAVIFLINSQEAEYQSHMRAPAQRKICLFVLQSQQQFWWIITVLWKHLKFLFMCVILIIILLLLLKNAN